MHSWLAKNSNSQPPSPRFLSCFSNMWEYIAYVWRAAFIIHAGSQFECGGELAFVWKRMPSRDLEKRSELSFMDLHHLYNSV